MIEGLEPIPLEEEGPDDELPDFRYRLFSVWLEDVKGSDVRQIRIGRWRVEDTAQVAGAFYLKPLREVLVAPAALGGGSVLHLFAPGGFFADRQKEVRARPMGRRAANPRRW